MDAAVGAGTKPMENFDLSDDGDVVVDVQQPEQLRKRPHSWCQKLQFYATFSSGVIAILAFFIFVFLVPFTIEPSLSTMQMDFDVTPVACCVVEFETRSGASQCSGWGSCREGCTRDIYDCFEIRVAYTDWTENFSCDTVAPDHQWIYSNATLLPNVKGCGYPPALNCTVFRSTYEATSSATFSCYYSRLDPSVVITTLDPGELKQRLVLSVALPSLSFAVAVAFLLYRLNTARSVTTPVPPAPPQKQIKSINQLLDQVTKPTIVRLLHTKSMSEPTIFELKKCDLKKSRRFSAHTTTRFANNCGVTTCQPALLVDGSDPADGRSLVHLHVSGAPQVCRYSWAPAVPADASWPVSASVANSNSSSNQNRQIKADKVGCIF